MIIINITPCFMGASSDSGSLSIGSPPVSSGASSSPEIDEIKSCAKPSGQWST